MVIRAYRQDQTEFERCFNIEAAKPLTAEELKKLYWVLAETFEPEKFACEPFLDGKNLVEIGPRLNFATAVSTNAVSICHAVGLTKITRVEISRRIILAPGFNREKYIVQNHDRMTEYEYLKPLSTFETGIKTKPVIIIPVLEQGEAAIAAINEEMGLGMDAWDISYYTKLFKDDLKRNPTDVECFQLGTANSEHSRHGFFKGKQIIDGQEMPRTLMEVIQEPLKRHLGNSIIAFHDNSSAIRGFKIRTIMPEEPGRCSRFVKGRVIYHLLFTAETHNFPTGVAPIPGAETGTGGRIRDTHATGRGSLKIAGTAGFCVGNLNIPGYHIPGEDDGTWPHPGNLCSPLEILLGESKGAWDYGNKIGEPVIQGFTRTFGLILPDGERCEFLKPIMFTGGIGQIDDRHIQKDQPQKGMLIVQIGGPAYRIGLGGGSASSMMQGENKADLDFNAVQRGDAEMENKVDRVIRACVEMGDKNPIRVIHDQGAGGPCNVLTELVDPAGGKIKIRLINVGDPTMSVLEIWGAEFQERDGFLIWEDRFQEFLNICIRERVNCELLGEITGDGQIVVYDENDGSIPVDLPLEKILGKMPQKTFESETIEKKLRPFELPESLTLYEAIKMVFALPSVGSKEGLLNRVDRSVTGLIARQQYCGPVQLPVSDVAVVAQSHFGLTGAAIAVGEQPIKMLVDEEAGARLAVGEMLTNMAGSLISGLSDIKCSVNWMWPAKLPGGGAALHRAAVAATDFIIKLQGAEPDGGKDSLSMAAKVGEQIVKSPGQMVVSGYVTMPDITRALTPDIKHPGKSRLMFINLNKDMAQLGGSALAQAHGQIGDKVPDIDAKNLRSGFQAIQKLHRLGLISAIHDISDGGFITTILEMAFAGNCGLDLKFNQYWGYDWASALFFENLGWVIEYDPKDKQKIQQVLKQAGFKGYCHTIGRTTKDKKVTVRFHGEVLLAEEMQKLRALWRETSFRLAAQVANPVCVDEEREVVYDRTEFQYEANFDYHWTKFDRQMLERREKPKVAILREEGTNGDREMTSAFWLAGFDTFDVSMTDLIGGKVSLKEFRGLIFPGGFSFADVLDSAKGWAAVIKFNQRVADEFSAFLARQDTFVFGVCNGCQLMALLDMVPWPDIALKKQPRFIKNTSGVFESRWTNLVIEQDDSIFLKGMKGSFLGCWVAHGEGRFYCPDQTIVSEILRNRLSPIIYQGTSYPGNPNGSLLGIAGLISRNNRYLAMMPHPERVFLPWQWPHWSNLKKGKVSPWFQLFRNARNWCDQS
ncbi:MAG: phosphoribosylformylglycinamidine synthase [Patescibacteria group bacterium]